VARGILHGKEWRWRWLIDCQSQKLISEGKVMELGGLDDVETQHRPGK